LTPTKPRRSRALFSTLLLAAWLVVLGLVALNRDSILDWVKLQGYQVPPTVASLASQDTMTGYGRKIFYINQPDIEEKGSFAKSCPNNGGEQTIVLGCYRAGESGIFLLKVDDSRLNGVMQVTAAHEMLHGAYERLSDADRKRVDAMLTDYYEHGLTDQRVRETIEAYKKSEPKDVVNEMHSVFGTEIANLPANLEHYYTRYFDDRAKVAAFAAQYQAQFTGRKQQIDQYDAQLTTLKNQIDAMETDLQSKQQQINTLQAQLNGQRRSGDVNSYNAGVPGYNSLVNEYNTEIQTAKSLIQQYNDLVKQRNAVAFEEDQLVKSLSTDALPAQ
jgi:hypothetical protein